MQEQTHHPQTLVIFGATGDLALRKLLPACSALVEKSSPLAHIVAFGRKDMTTQDYHLFAKDAFLRIHKQQQTSAFDEMLKRVVYHKGQLDCVDDIASLAEHLKQLHNGVAHRCLFYLATPPTLFEPVLTLLKQHTLLDDNNAVLLEKPLGNDEASARRLNALLLSFTDEKNIYRIDHYLAKELVQNVLVLRFANALFEHLWSNRHIDCVQVTVSEQNSVGTRGNYYDAYGALKDMVQNHLLQIVALVAMEPPISMHADHVRDEKVKVFKSIRLPDEGLCVVRGQYKGVDGQKSYTQEENVPAQSTTETYIALKLFVNNWRWHDVPFYVRTGKAMQKNTAQVVIEFKGAPPVLFAQQLEHNKLIITIQPDEIIKLSFNVKPPGKQKSVEEVHMEFCHSCLYGVNTPQAYERLLADAFVGDQTLFTRADGLESAWRIVDDVAKRFANTPLQTYDVGSMGPAQADELLDGDKWYTEK